MREATANPYETEKLVHEYLLFHYGSAGEVMPWDFGPTSALRYPARCVSECFELSELPRNARALDLGCAVGRSTFEFARHCTEVIGIDYSRRFVEVAGAIARDGAVPYLRVDEGSLTTELTATIPAGLDPSRVQFEHGDAQALRATLGKFDAVLAANLIDRLGEPLRFLKRLPELLNPGGELVITSPYTWMADYTPIGNWVGGYETEAGRRTTLEGIRAALDSDFEFRSVKDLPFLIREHSRKFQWSVAQASIWRRR